MRIVPPADPETTPDADTARLIDLFKSGLDGNRQASTPAAPTDNVTQAFLDGLSGIRRNTDTETTTVDDAMAIAENDKTAAPDTTSDHVERIDVDEPVMKEYNNGDIIQFEIYKDMFGAEVPQTIDKFLELKNTNSPKWQSLKESLCTRKALQKQLAYFHDGEQLFIPKHTQFDTIVTIAGDKTSTPIRVVNTLVKSYGGTSADWNKCAGKITSSKYVFDLHWYEKDGVQYDMKLKHRKEK